MQSNDVLLGPANQNLGSMAINEAHAARLIRGAPNLTLTPSRVADPSLVFRPPQRAA